MPSAPFSDFATTLADIAEEPGRNAKADRLGELLDGLTDDDLRRAVRWAAGRVFPLPDQRTVNVGHAALLRAIAAASGREPDDLRARLVHLGDPGDLAAETLGTDDDRRDAPRGVSTPDHPRLGPEADPPAFSLQDAETFFADLAATRGSNAKTEATAGLLARLGPQEARFIVKLLTGETRIGLLQGGVEAALARTFERDAGAVRRAHMLTGDLGETAVLAREDALDTASFALFHPLTFMLATPAEAAPGEDPAPEVARLMPETFAVEDKFDGIRAQAHIAPNPGDEDLHGVTHDGVRVALFSRTLDENTGQFPDLVPALAALATSAPGGLVLDGEIVPLDTAHAATEAGPLRAAPFASLQKRLGRKKPPRAIIEAHPVAFVAYDAILHDGELLLDTPLDDRLARLDAVPLAPPLHRSRVTVVADAARLDAMFDQARARGNEGLMVKRLDSRYRPGRRGREWLKIKRALATLDVVVTSVEVGSGGRRKYLSDFTFAVRRSEHDPELVNVGKAYSGLTDAELQELTDWFKAHTQQQFAHGRVRVVDPEVVIEVAFDGVQESKRHKSGFALRFPRIVRLRRDKPASEADTVQTVRAIYQSQFATPDARDA